MLGTLQQALCGERQCASTRLRRATQLDRARRRDCRRGASVRSGSRCRRTGSRSTAAPSRARPCSRAPGPAGDTVDSRRAAGKWRSAARLDNPCGHAATATLYRPGSGSDAGAQAATPGPVPAAAPSPAGQSAGRASGDKWLHCQSAANNDSSEVSTDSDATGVPVRSPRAGNEPVRSSAAVEPKPRSPPPREGPVRSWHRKRPPLPSPAVPPVAPAGPVVSPPPGSARLPAREPARRAHLPVARRLHRRRHRSGTRAAFGVADPAPRAPQAPTRAGTPPARVAPQESPKADRPAPPKIAVPSRLRPNSRGGRERSGAISSRQRQPLAAVDELHAVAGDHRRRSAVVEGAQRAVVHPDRNRPLGLGVGVLFHLVSGHGAQAHARDGGDRITPATADLVAQNAAQHAPGHHAHA